MYFHDLSLDVTGDKPISPKLNELILVKQFSVHYFVN